MEHPFIAHYLSAVICGTGASLLFGIYMSGKEDDEWSGWKTLALVSLFVCLSVCCNLFIDSFAYYTEFDNNPEKLLKTYESNLKLANTATYPELSDEMLTAISTVSKDLSFAEVTKARNNVKTCLSILRDDAKARDDMRVYLQKHSVTNKEKER